MCVLSSSSDKLFFLARTVAVTAQKLQIHWYGSKKIDSTYTLEYGQKASKGLGAPNVATIWRHTIIDTVKSVKGQRGKIDTSELKRLIALATEATANRS